MVSTYKIAVIKGDGIGPELMKEGLKVLRAIESISDIKFEFTDAPAGADHYVKTGEVLPKESMEIYKTSDAIYKAPVGDPKLPPELEQHGFVLPLRQGLGAYVNIRPIRLYDELKEISPLKAKNIGDGINFTIIRENSEGLYARVGGVKGKIEHKDEKIKKLLAEIMESIGAAAIDVNKYTEKGVDRIIRFAFEYAVKNGRTKVTSVDKANVMYASRLWREKFNQIAKEYPNIETESILVDAFSQYIVRWPYSYQVVVTDNIFGDILSDEGTAVTGSLGMGGSANVNPDGVSVFEPLHGSAPDIAGKGIANPISMVLSAKMMLEILGHDKEAKIIDEAIVKALQQGHRTKDISSGDYCTTEEMGTAIVNNILGKV
jgi:3-isopropylmalate dehydrogenase